jgi:hypothetical protein
MGLANAETAGKKRKSEPQVVANTPTHDDEQAPPPIKKKKRLASLPLRSSLPNHLAQPPTRKGSRVLLPKQKG